MPQRLRVSHALRPGRPFRPRDVLSDGRPDYAAAHCLGLDMLTGRPHKPRSLQFLQRRRRFPGGFLVTSMQLPLYIPLGTVVFLPAFH